MQNMSSIKISKRLTASICIILMILLTVSCGKNSGNHQGNKTDGAPETTVVRLALFPNGHILNAIAEEQGYLEEEGITVEYVPVNSDAEVFEGIENGTIDVASNSGTNLPLQQIADGQDLTIFGGYLLTGCMPVFAKVDTEWNGIESLIGKTMACEPNLYAITGPLLDAGYDPLHDVTWYQPDTQEERIKAVKEGKADFGLVGTQLNYAINSDPELKVCVYASDVLPDYSCCRVEAKTEWVNANPNTVKALLRAWIRAMAYYDNHHDETVLFQTEQTGQSEAYIRAFMDNPHCNLNVDPMMDSVVRAWNYMDALGLLSMDAEEIDITDHINTQLYKEALDECQELYGEENPKFYEKMQAEYSTHDMDITEIVEP